jgi:hypothetical protein
VVAIDVKRLATTRSMSLEMNEKLEIGRWESARSGLNDSFFLRSGRTRAC